MLLEAQPEEFGFAVLGLLGHLLVRVLEVEGGPQLLLDLLGPRQRWNEALASGGRGLNFGLYIPNPSNSGN